MWEWEEKFNVFLFKEDPLNLLLNSNSIKSQYVIPRSAASGITLALSSDVVFSVVIGLKAAP